MQARRYSELDWLRVILILLVFVHHVFMPFNGDSWHIMNAESSKLLDNVMVYFEQLRLPVLFFIAGAGSFLLLEKMNAKAFIVKKFQRLFIPLLVGMMLVNPPQGYFENIDKYANLRDAYKQLFFSFNANHLWFIEFLIIFMLLAIPVKKVLNSGARGNLTEKVERLMLAKHGLFFLVVPIIIVRCALKILLPSQDHSIVNLSVVVFFLMFFIAGMYFIKRPEVWRSLAENRLTNLKWFVFCSIVFYGYYFSPDLTPYASTQVLWQVWWAVCTLVSWSGLLVLVGYASAFFKDTPAWLVTANELIYPFYILHQTVIVVFAFYIVQWDVGIPAKSISLLISSFICCSLFCYYVIKPISVFRYLFGLKRNISR